MMLEHWDAYFRQWSILYWDGHDIKEHGAKAAEAGLVPSSSFRMVTDGRFVL
jgi:hypothetical protein